jgi:peptidyl-tRNA hydrolase, PTH1 family
MTYMNESGRSVRQATNFFKISADRMLILCDDFSLPLGKLRVRREGSSGGQKGLGSILQVFGTQEIPRLRIGIDPVPPRWDVADYVLSRFSDADRKIIDVAIECAGDAVETWVKSGITACMNLYNTSKNK